MKRLVVSFSLLLFAMAPAQAGVVDDLKKSLRPHLIKILGEETTTKILGPSSDKVTLPKIPKVIENAKDSTSIGGKAKSQVKFEEKESQRYNYFYVKEVIKVTQQREATDSEVSKWMNVLGQNGSRSGVYRASVLDRYYSRLENEDYKSNESVISFTLYFIEKYLDKSISRKTLEGANFYTIKRSITEKALEVMEEFFKMPGDELYDWYGVLSQDFAENHPDAMDNKVRKMTSAYEHKRWAKGVPDQYLRSELIIKLHRVFNSLQVK